MAERAVMRFFKGVEREQFEKTFESLLIKHGGTVMWGKKADKYTNDCRTSHRGDVQGLYLPYVGGSEYLLCKAVGDSLHVPWIEVRIQEGTFWDYTAFIGDKIVDDFSALPEYWGLSRKEQKARAGVAKVIARVWGVPDERIERYIRQWGNGDKNARGYVLKGKAYPADRYEYGDFRQVFDFINALGGANPLYFEDGAEGHFVEIPELGVFKRATTKAAN